MKKTKIISAVILALITALVCLFYVPQFRVRLFVYAYHEQIEAGIAENKGVPASDAVIGGYKYVNTWCEEPWMTEFVLLKYGKYYYGCYYSPDDIPFSFQNISDELTQNGHDYWTWQVDSDSGSTSKIIDNWYYFKAAL